MFPSAKKPVCIRSQRGYELIFDSLADISPYFVRRLPCELTALVWQFMAPSTLAILAEQDNASFLDLSQLPSATWRHGCLSCTSRTYYSVSSFWSDGNTLKVHSYPTSCSTDIFHSAKISRLDSLDLQQKTQPQHEVLVKSNNRRISCAFASDGRLLKFDFDLAFYTKDGIPLSRLTGYTTTLVSENEILFIGGLEVRPQDVPLRTNFIWMFDNRSHIMAPFLHHASEKSPWARHSHSSVLVQDIVWVFGGIANRAGPTASVLWLNVKTKEWGEAQDMLEPRTKPFLAYHGGRILVYGGDKHNKKKGTPCYLDSFDCATKLWADTRVLAPRVRKTQFGMIILKNCRMQPTQKAS